MAKKNNPYVSVEMCNQRHGELTRKIDEVLILLRGDTKDSDKMGILGDLRDIKRDKKWIWALLTLLGIPLFFLIFNYMLKG